MKTNPGRKRSLRIGLALAISLLGLALLPLLALPYDRLDWASLDPPYQACGPCPPPPPVVVPRRTQAIGTATVSRPEPSATEPALVPAPPSPMPALACAELPAPGEPLAARVNGQGIGLSTFEREFDQFLRALQASGVDPESAEAQAEAPAWRRQVLDLLIEDVLIQQAAAEAGIAVSAEEVQLRATEEISQGKLLEWFEQWLAVTGQTREEFERDICQGLLDQAVRDWVTRDMSGTTEIVWARQIVVTTENAAQAALARLKAGRPFVAVAQELSVDQASRRQGGSLGWFSRGSGRVPPEVEEAAFAGIPGEVQGPIRVGNRYVIVQTLDFRLTSLPDSGDGPPASATSFEHWLAERRARATIEIFIDLD